ncbi:hypothetical protein ACF07Y_40630 [Streptomyces sp. NPDC016566]|uniref:hypothetical protein n=1 Tax=unclassified Streptomyces TaxID=2593676 RepID=UPI0036E4ECB5
MTKAEIIARLSDYLAAQRPADETDSVDAHRAMFVSYWQQAQQLAGGDTGLAIRCAREAASMSSLPGESAEHAAARHAALPTHAFGDREVTILSDPMQGQFFTETVNPMWNDKVGHFFASAELAFSGPFEWLSADGNGHGFGVGETGARVLGYGEEVIQLGHNAAHAIGFPVAPHFGAMDPGDLYVNGCGAAFGADAREHGTGADILRYLRAPDEDDATAPPGTTPSLPEAPPDTGQGFDAGVPPVTHRDAETGPPPPSTASPDPIGQVTLGDGVWADRAGNWHPVLPVTSPDDLSGSSFTTAAGPHDADVSAVGDPSGAKFTGTELHPCLPGVAGPAGVDHGHAAGTPLSGASLTADHLDHAQAAGTTQDEGHGLAAPAAGPAPEQGYEASGATFAQGAALQGEHAAPPADHAPSQLETAPGTEAAAAFGTEH